MTDSSDTEVGAVLQQHIKGSWHPISFFSKKMTSTEKHYSTFDRELLAIKHFRHFLEGREFHVRGRQFESHLWKNLMSFLGCKRSRTTAYHQQSNGMVERFYRQLKCGLKAQTNTNSWMDVLPLVLLGIQTPLKEDISSIATELVYSTTLCLLKNTSLLQLLNHCRINPTMSDN